MPEFVRKMQVWRGRDDDGVRAWINDRIAAYREKAQRQFRGSRRRLARVHEKFALDYAAGALAIRLGILPWKRSDLGDAILACEAAHVATTEPLSAASGSEGADAKVDDPFDKFVRYVRQNRSRFIDVRDELIADPVNHDHAACPGYVGKGKGGTEFWFAEDTLVRVCGSRAAAAALKRTLRERGFLMPDGNRPSTRRHVYAGPAEDGRVQVIAVKVRNSKLIIDGRPARSGTGRDLEHAGLDVGLVG